MMNDWPVEEIPDPDGLFYRVSIGWLRPGDLRIAPGIFRENRGSISSDWEKYSTAAQTRSRQGRPESFAVIRMIAGFVREIDGLTVLHSPIQNIDPQLDNRAHSSICGLESPVSAKPDLGRKEKIRTELQMRFNNWEIPPNAPAE
jgi:hypothetical protein